MFIVLEIQANGDQVGTIINKYGTRAEAESAFHGILSSAAVSHVQIHSAVLLSIDGQQIDRKTYIHEA